MVSADEQRAYKRSAYLKPMYHTSCCLLTRWLSPAPTRRRATQRCCNRNECESVWANADVRTHENASFMNGRYGQTQTGIAGEKNVCESDHESERIRGGNRTAAELSRLTYLVAGRHAFMSNEHSVSETPPRTFNVQLAVSASSPPCVRSKIALCQCSRGIGSWPSQRMNSASIASDLSPSRSPDTSLEGCEAGAQLLEYCNPVLA